MADPHADLDQDREPLIEAALAFHELATIPFLIPGHKQGRALDQRTRRELGENIHRFDISTTNGLDDRLARGGIVKHAQRRVA